MSRKKRKRAGFAVAQGEQGPWFSGLHSSKMAMLLLPSVTALSERFAYRRQTIRNQRTRTKAVKNEWAGRVTELENDGGGAGDPARVSARETNGGMGREGFNLNNLIELDSIFI